MKNTKGFTLVEILGVIAILAVLALIAVPTIDTIVTKNREKLYQAQLQSIKDGLKTWGDANALYLPDAGQSAININLGVLKLSGFVEPDISNPNTKLCFSNNMKVSISAVKDGYSYSYDEATGLNGITTDCAEPTALNYIFLKGSSSFNVAVGGTYTDSGYITVDSKGMVVTGATVTTVIRDKNNAVVGSINTAVTTSSPYTITYTYGTASVVRTVTIS